MPRAQTTAPGWEWARGSQAPEFSTPSATCVGANGNFYLAATFQHSIQVGSHHFTADSEGQFIAEYSPAGVLLKAFAISDTGNTGGCFFVYEYCRDALNTGFLPGFLYILSKPSVGKLPQPLQLLQITPTAG